MGDFLGRIRKNFQAVFPFILFLSKLLFLTAEENNNGNSNDNGRGKAENNLYI